jgi:transcriptional regulator with XRE-family HTH domain
MFQEVRKGISMAQTWLPGDTRQRIQDLIRNNDTTQAELAEAAGLSESALSRYLSGQTETLGDVYIIRIARRFNVSTDFLLGETNIPDRKNYEIEELGLSYEAAKLLYTEKIDPGTLNLLLEHPKFPELISLLRRYQDKTMATGIAAFNQTLSGISSLLASHGEQHPEDAVAAAQAANDVRMQRRKIVNYDYYDIQNLFMTIVKDIQKQAPVKNTGEAPAGARFMERLVAEAAKGQEERDLSKLTLEDISAATVGFLKAFTNINEQHLEKLGPVFTDIMESAGET